ALLARPEKDEAVIEDERWVVRVDRDGISGDGRGADDDLRAGGLERRPERTMLPLGGVRIGSAVPAVVTPPGEIAGDRRPDVHAAKRVVAVHRSDARGPRRLSVVTVGEAVRARVLCAVAT